MKKIIIGADGLGTNLKDALAEHLIQRGYEVQDLGTKNYYEIGALVGKAISSGTADGGVMCCATGMGPTIVANKFPGVYSGVLESEFTAQRCKIVNNCNAISIGEQVVGQERAKGMVDLWLDGTFGSGCGFDELAGFLKDALGEIRKIEDANMK
ncbi:RpiB/LacA/LacB family sugar-phosphate isomerase [Eubacteriales bacterium OttesenSCG-928-N14]|nr:RpiB/LacA/LacB family sugar-phosphate isomerase [Eubacteriales bacterium OttesenSCG-928-N14]